MRKDREEEERQKKVMEEKKAKQVNTWLVEVISQLVKYPIYYIIGLPNH